MFRCRQPIVGWPNPLPRRPPPRAAGLLVLLALPLAALAAESLDALLAQGTRQFERREFEAALASFESAARLAPNDERPPLWVGRSAGRLAETASPVSAYRLARRTLRAFEHAYALNPRNLDVLDDLIEFHEKAPRFIGGRPALAAQLRERRSQLRAEASAATP